MKAPVREISKERQAVQNDSWPDAVRQRVGSLRVGVVQIVVHESLAVQIERTEKVRLSQPLARVSGAPWPAGQETWGQRK